VNGDLVTIGDDTFKAGDTLTIDGTSGEVFVGAVSSGAEIVPEAAKLLSWAAELGIEIGAPESADEEESDVDKETAAADISRDDLIHVMLIKGFVTPTDLAPILFTTSETVSTHLDHLVASGLAELIGGSALAGMFQLSATGKAMGVEGIAQDRAKWGAEPATKALDDLLPLDLRMKSIMTDWQMREVDGQQVLNDHTDESHDAAVLAEFASLHTDSVAWLGSLSDGPDRLATYVARLDRAAAQVAGGDTAYLASPRIDSFHNVWFELHEDLIQLAGRTREEEAAAGRA
jgi:pyruvate,orthophosphate dikinase